MSALFPDVPIEDPYEHERFESDYDAEGACVQCVALKAEIDLLRSEILRSKCWECGAQLSARKVEMGEKFRAWCSTHCYYESEKQKDIQW